MSATIFPGCAGSQDARGSDGPCRSSPAHALSACGVTRRIGVSPGGLVARSSVQAGGCEEVEGNFRPVARSTPPPSSSSARSPSHRVLPDRRRFWQLLRRRRRYPFRDLLVADARQVWVDRCDLEEHLLLRCDQRHRLGFRHFGAIVPGIHFNAGPHG